MSAYNNKDAGDKKLCDANEEDTRLVSHGIIQRGSVLSWYHAACTTTKLCLFAAPLKKDIRTKTFEALKNAFVVGVRNYLTFSDTKFYIPRSYPRDNVSPISNLEDHPLDNLGIMLETLQSFFNLLPLGLFLTLIFILVSYILQNQGVLTWFLWLQLVIFAHLRFILL